MSEFRCEICDRPLQFPVFLGEVDEPMRNREAAMYYDVHLRTHYSELMGEFVAYARKSKTKVAKSMVARLRAIEGVLLKRQMFGK